MLRGTNHAKYSLKYHVVLTTKYRKKLLSSIGSIGIFVKDKINEIALRNNFIIHSIEVDQDHVHFLIETKPRIIYFHSFHNEPTVISHKL